jgi:hypothetical protein
MNNIGIDLEFDCTYKKVELKYLAELPKDLDGQRDKEAEEDILFLCEEVYREDFLKFFKTNTFDDSLINKKVSELLKLCQGNERFIKIFSLLSAKISIFREDIEQTFMQLFSYHFFYLTHDCMKQLATPNEFYNDVFDTLEHATNSFNTE